MARTPRVRYEISAEDKTRRAFRSVQQGLGGLASAMNGLKGELAAVLSVGGLAKLIKDGLRTADELQKLSVRLGSTTEALSELQHVAGLSGVSFQTMSLGLQRMTRRVAEAAQGTGEAKAAIAELGLDAAKLARLRPEQQFELFADALAQVGTQSDRVRLAMKLFDSEGVALLQTMERGAAGIQQMRAEARALGKTLSKDQADAAVRARNAMQRLRTTMQGLATTTATQLGPWLEGLANFFSVHLPEAVKLAEIAFATLRHFMLQGVREILAGLETMFRALTLSPAAERALKLVAAGPAVGPMAGFKLAAMGLLQVQNALGGSAEKAAEGLAEMDKLLGELQQDYALATGETTRFEAGVAGVVAQVDAANVPLTESGEALSDFEKRLKRLLPPLDAMGDKHTKMMLLREELELMRGQLDPAVYVAYKAQLDAIERSMTRTTDTVAKMSEEVRIAGDQFEELRNLIDRAGDTITDTFIESTKSGKLAFKDMVSSILEDAARLTFKQNIAQPLSRGIAGFATEAILGLLNPTRPLAAGNIGFKGPPAFSAPRRAAGGPLAEGQPAIVGERGPELFVPRQSGTVVPNAELGDTNVYITIHAVDAPSVAALLHRNREQIVGIIREARRRKVG